MDELQAQINEALRLAFLHGVEFAIDHIRDQDVNFEEAAQAYVESLNE